MLTARFHILQHPARLWYMEDIFSIEKACIIMPNMILEARRDGYDSRMGAFKLADDARVMSSNGISSEMLSAIVSERETLVTTRTEPQSLHNDLSQHSWERHGQ